MESKRGENKRRTNERKENNLMKILFQSGKVIAGSLAVATFVFVTLHAFLFWSFLAVL